MKAKPDNKYIFLVAHTEKHSNLNIEFGMLAVDTNNTLRSQGKVTPDDVIVEIEDLAMAVMEYGLTQARRENMRVVWEDSYGMQEVEDDVMVMTDGLCVFWEAVEAGSGGKVRTYELPVSKLREFMASGDIVLLVMPLEYGDTERETWLHSIRQWLEAKAREVAENFVAPEGINQDFATQTLLDEITDIDNMGDSNPDVSAESRMNKEAVLAYLAWLEINDKP